MQVTVIWYNEKLQFIKYFMIKIEFLYLNETK